MDNFVYVHAVLSGTPNTVSNLSQYEICLGFYITHLGLINRKEKKTNQSDTLLMFIALLLYNSADLVDSGEIMWTVK